MNHTKDSYWFRHDSNAKDDFKCMLLIEQLGCEGFGIFWILVETLREQKDYRYPFSLIGGLARKYNTTQAKMETVVKEYQLFELDENSFFFSHSFDRRMENLDKVKEQRRLAGVQSGISRKKKAIELTLNTCSTSVERLDKNREKEKRKKLEELKQLIVNKSANALHEMFNSEEYKLIFSGKVLAQIEKDKGFSNIKILLNNSDYDEWVMKKLIE